MKVKNYLAFLVLIILASCSNNEEEVQQGDIFVKVKQPLLKNGKLSAENLKVKLEPGNKSYSLGTDWTILIRDIELGSYQVKVSNDSETVFGSTGVSVSEGDLLEVNIPLTVTDEFYEGKPELRIIGLEINEYYTHSLDKDNHVIVGKVSDINSSADQIEIVATLKRYDYFSEVIYKGSPNGDGEFEISFDNPDISTGNYTLEIKAIDENGLEGIIVTDIFLFKSYSTQLLSVEKVNGGTKVTWEPVEQDSNFPSYTIEAKLSCQDYFFQVNSIYDYSQSSYIDEGIYPNGEITYRIAINSEVAFVSNEISIAHESYKLDGTELTLGGDVIDNVLPFYQVSGMKERDSIQDSYTARYNAYYHDDLVVHFGNDEGVSLSEFKRENNIHYTFNPNNGTRTFKNVPVGDTIVKVIPIDENNYLFIKESYDYYSNNAVYLYNSTDDDLTLLEGLDLHSYSYSYTTYVMNDDENIVMISGNEVTYFLNLDDKKVVDFRGHAFPELKQIAGTNNYVSSYGIYTWDADKNLFSAKIEVLDGLSNWINVYQYEDEYYFIETDNYDPKYVYYNLSDETERRGAVGRSNSIGGVEFKITESGFIATDSYQYGCEQVEYYERND